MLFSSIKGIYMLALLVFAVFSINVVIYLAQIKQNELSAVEEENSRLSFQNKQLKQSYEDKLEQFNALSIQLEEQKKLIDLLKQQSNPIHSLPTPDEQQNNEKISDKGYAVLVITYNRPEYLNQTLTTLMKFFDSDYDIVISQDGQHQGVQNLVNNFKQVHKSRTNIEFFQRTDRSLPPMKPNENEAYYHISQHYKFALRNTFNMGYSKVVIIEEDLKISPDFFSYFTNAGALLDKDPTLFCVSAWNDNGLSSRVSDPNQLYRSNFFPGLGWLLTSNLWKEFEPKWPGGFWDDWVREPEQRKDRDCIRPEISRTYNIGRIGTSVGQFFDKISKVKLNDENIDWSKEDLDYLIKENYDKKIETLINDAKIITDFTKLENEPKTNSPLLINYKDNNEFKQITKKYQLMDDFKAGIPRTAYNGLIFFRVNENLVILRQM